MTGSGDGASAIHGPQPRPSASYAQKDRRCARVYAAAEVLALGSMVDGSFTVLAEPAATRLLSMYVRVEPLLPFVVLAILVFFFFYFFSRFQTVDA